MHSVQVSIETVLPKAALELGHAKCSASLQESVQIFNCPPEAFVAMRPDYQQPCQSEQLLRVS